MFLHSSLLLGWYTSLQKQTLKMKKSVYSRVDAHNVTCLLRHGTEKCRVCVEAPVCPVSDLPVSCGWFLKLLDNTDLAASWLHWPGYSPSRSTSAACYRWCCCSISFSKIDLIPETRHKSYKFDLTQHQWGLRPSLKKKNKNCSHCPLKLFTTSLVSDSFSVWSLPLQVVG